MAKEEEKYWHSAAFEKTKDLMHIGWRLQDLADALHTVGNTKLSDELNSLGKDILEAQDTISRKISEGCHEQFVQSEQSAKNTVLAALAICNHEANAFELGRQSANSD